MPKSSIGYCVELTGEDLTMFAGWISGVFTGKTVEQVEIATNDNGLRIKTNWGVWSPPIGKVIGTP